ncbi:MAG TPA: carotenoid 1,2-hydratase [Mesorhizobium sp.]|jgi:predicted secreted hydrolase|nr:carotenoid 1,2-hydratase [Mesorhizobium sp.]
MRWLLALLALMFAAAAAAQSAVNYPEVRPGAALSFPRDHGAHPEFRTEWWYVTGWLETEDGRDLGFQVTFFRTRPQADPQNPSRFAPAQVLFAHAALSDPAVGRLLHGERAARAGFGIAEAAQGDAAVTLQDWRFARGLDGVFTTEVSTPEFSFSLGFSPTQDVFLQGDGGYSQKGPDPLDASYYYSLPHLTVSGTVSRDGETVAVTGEAWLDREWSSNLLAPDAVGWEWTGLNLDDGGALVAFRIRDRQNETVWAGGSLRRGDGSIVRFRQEDVRFSAVRRWRSPRTNAEYPVEQVLEVRLPEGVRRFPLRPLFDDQELDGRASGLPVYWEGAVRTDGGKGYLELTGFTSPLAL